MPDHPVLRAALYSLIGFSFFAFCDAFAKHLTMEKFSSFQISVVYCCISIVFLFLFSKKLGGVDSARNTKHPKFHFIRALLFGPSQVLNFYAFSKLPMANVYTVLFMTPFLTTFLAHYILKEKTSLMTWFCILCGFAGVIIVNRPDIYHIGWPILAAVSSTLIAAYRNVITRKMGFEESAFALSLFPCFGIIAVSLLPAIKTGIIPTPENAVFFLLGGLCFAVGTICVSFSMLQKVNLSIVTPFHYSQIIWGILFGIFIFSNIPDLLTWIGSAIIILSGIGLVYSRNMVLKRN